MYFQNTPERKALAEKREKFAKLKKAMDKLEFAQQEMQKVLQKISKQISTTEVTVKRINLTQDKVGVEIKKATASKALTEKIAKDLQAKIDENEELLRKYMQEPNIVQARDLVTQINKLDESVENQLDYSDERIKELRTAIDNAKREKETAIAEKEKLDKTLEDLKTKSKIMSQHKVEYQEALPALREIEGTLKNSQKSWQQSKDELKKLDEDIKKLDTQLGNISVQMQEASNKVDKLKENTGWGLGSLAKFFSELYDKLFGEPKDKPKSKP